MELSRNENVTHASKKFDEVKQNLHEAKDKASEAVKNLKDQVSESASDMKDKMADQVQDYSEQITEYVKKSPMKAVGIAALAGALIGMAIRK